LALEVADGELEPANPCEACTPFESTTQFLAVPAGQSCGSGEICNGGGGCAADCYVAGVLYGSGQLGAGAGAGACEVCDPTVTTSTFQAVPVGTSCGKGEICTGAVGGCAADCYIGGVLYASGQTASPSGNGAWSASGRSSVWSAARPGEGPESIETAIARFSATTGDGETWVHAFPDHPEQDFIKRVIALPGDRLDLDSGDSNPRRPHEGQTHPELVGRPCPAW
jgi:hypothetical protein